MVAEVMPLLILGGTGKLGTILRNRWPWAMREGMRPIWQSRAARAGFLEWDILNAPAPPWAGGVVLCLAGGRGAANTDLALAAMEVAQAQGARHVFLASSAAVYGAGSDLDEDAAPNPLSSYGVEKLAMEAAAIRRVEQSGPGLTILRIGNVAGADALLGTSAPHVTLDPVDGQDGGPLRSYIGPVCFASVLARLAAMAVTGAILPRVLNVATPRPVSMGALLDASGLRWTYGPQSPDVVPVVTMNTLLLQSIIKLPPQASQPRAIVAEWRMAGQAA